MSASCTKSTLGPTASCSTVQHIVQTHHVLMIYNNQHRSCLVGDGKNDTNCFFHIFSIALATASLQTLSITITTFSLSPNSFHPSTLSIINLSFLDLSSTKYSHFITKWSMSSTSPFIYTFLTHPICSPHSVPPSYHSNFHHTMCSMYSLFSMMI